MGARKPKFIVRNSAPSDPPTTWQTFKAFLASSSSIIFSFAAVILLSAIIFYIGIPNGWGIETTFQSGDGRKEPALGFLDCLYFSVVTIATLGYGDLRPVSYGRLVAGFEVISGVVLMGVFIARLVSRQQDRLARRLLKGYLNSEVQSFRELLKDLSEKDKPNDSTDPSIEVSPYLFACSRVVKSIAKYWRYEAREIDLAQVIPLRAAGRLLGDLVELLESVSAKVGGKGPKSIHEENRAFIRNITESALAIGYVLADRIDDDGINHLYEKISGLVEILRDQLKLEKMRIR